MVLNLYDIQKHDVTALDVLMVFVADVELVHGVNASAMMIDWPDLHETYETAKALLEKEGLAGMPAPTTVHGHICDPNQRRPLYDARRIFCGYVCDTCELSKRHNFRADIFDNPDYEHDEPIDGDFFDE